MANKKNIQSAKKSNKNKSGNRSVAVKAAGSQGAGGGNTKKPEENKVRRFFTVAICIIVALGLMIPVAGLGVASCGAGTQTSQTQSTP